MMQESESRYSVNRLSEDSQVFRVFLEKRGRARGAFSLFTGKPWATRTFKLKKQQLQYFEQTELRGQINIAGCEVRLLQPSEADGKAYPFELQCSDGEKLVLNASCEDIRTRCVQIFRKASVTSNWTLPRGLSKEFTTSSNGEKSSPAQMLSIQINDRETRTLWFYEAVNEGTVEEVLQLYAAFKDLIVVDYICPEDGQTPLTSACYRNDLEMVRCLIETCKANVNAPNYYGITALMLAANFNRKELAKYLVTKAHADVNRTSQNGETAFGLAVDEDMKNFLVGGESDEIPTPSQAPPPVPPPRPPSPPVSLAETSPSDGASSDFARDNKVSVPPTLPHTQSDEPNNTSSDDEEILEGVPLSLYLACYSIAVGLAEVAVGDALRQRDVTLAKERTVARDALKIQLKTTIETLQLPLSLSHVSRSSNSSQMVTLTIDPLAANAVIASTPKPISNSLNKFQEYSECPSLSSNRQWIETALSQYIDRLWTNDKVQEHERFDAIERASEFVDRIVPRAEDSEASSRIVDGTRSVSLHDREGEYVRVLDDVDLSLWNSDPEAQLRVKEALLIFLSSSKTGVQQQRVSVRLAHRSQLSRMEHEFARLIAMSARSDRVVLRPLTLLTAVGSIRDKQNGPINEDLIALVTESREQNLCQFFSQGSHLRAGERLLLAESLVEFVRLAHQNSICLSLSLSLQNIVRARDSKEFVLESLSYAADPNELLNTAFLAKALLRSGVASDCGMESISFDAAEAVAALLDELVVQSDDSDGSAGSVINFDRASRRTMTAQLSSDISALGWMLWTCMGGSSLVSWQQGINPSQLEAMRHAVKTISTISQLDISSAILREFPKSHMFSLRRLLEDCLQRDEELRCDLERVFENYSFFGHVDGEAEQAFQRAKDKKQEDELLSIQQQERERSEHETIERERVLVQATLCSVISQLETLPCESDSLSLLRDQMQSVIASCLQSLPISDAKPSVAICALLSKVCRSLTCDRKTLITTLKSICNEQLVDLIALQDTIESLRTSLRAKGHCMPHLFCVLPGVSANNNSASSNTSSNVSHAGPSMSGASRRLSIKALSLQQYKHLFWNRSRLYFICPVTLQITRCGRNQKGYSLDPPVEWIEHSADILRAGIVAMKLALLVQTSTVSPTSATGPDDLDSKGLKSGSHDPNDDSFHQDARPTSTRQPISPMTSSMTFMSIEDMDQVVSMLRDIHQDDENATDSLSAEEQHAAASTTDSRTDEKDESSIDTSAVAPRSLSDRLQELFAMIGLEEGVDVTKRFSTWKLQRTGLCFATCATQGKIYAWVSEDSRNRFEAEGEGSFML